MVQCLLRAPTATLVRAALALVAALVAGSACVSARMTVMVTPTLMDPHMVYNVTTKSKAAFTITASSLWSLEKERATGCWLWYSRLNEDGVTWAATPANPKPRMTMVASAKGNDTYQITLADNTQFPFLTDPTRYGIVPMCSTTNLSQPSDDSGSPDKAWPSNRLGETNLRVDIRSAAKCNDGVVEYWDGEDCDVTGPTAFCTDCKCSGPRYVPQWRYDSRLRGCSLCGNNVIDEGELCDPPVPNKCTAKCQCAQGLVYNTDSKQCEIPCGNGRLDPGEQCDGNSESCSACQCKTGYVPQNQTTCTLCGNGKVDAFAGEDCDYALYGDGCNLKCKCNRGYKGANQQCLKVEDTDNTPVIVGAVVGGVGGAIVLVVLGVVIVVLALRQSKRQAPANFPVELSSGQFMPISTAAGNGGGGLDAPSTSSGRMPSSMGAAGNQNLASAFEYEAPGPMVGVQMAPMAPMGAVGLQMGPMVPPPPQQQSTILYDAAGNPVPVMLVGGTPVVHSASGGTGTFSSGGGTGPATGPHVDSQQGAQEPPPAIPTTVSPNIFSSTGTGSAPGIGIQSAGVQSGPHS
eukprot:m51a1_g7087 putative protein kinase domain containing protein (575) ;mRNA; f:19127-21212